MEAAEVIPTPTVYINVEKACGWVLEQLDYMHYVYTTNFHPITKSLRIAHYSLGFYH